MAAADRMFWARLVRVDAVGVHVEVASLGGQFGPLRSLLPLDAVAALPAGAVLLVSTVGGLPEDLVVLGRVTGSPTAPPA